MRIAVYSTKPYDASFFREANAAAGHELVFLEPRLGPQTATLAAGCDAACVFVNDVADRGVLATLAEGGARAVALRCAGFNNVDLTAAEELGLAVVRVPAYSPYAVAEHTVALMLTLNRKTHRAYARVREGNFALQGLLGFDMRGRTVGVVGAGKIGEAVARIMLGFGCRVLAYDPYPNDSCREAGVAFVPLDALLRDSDIVTLHCPLTPQTRHMINRDTLATMRPGVMLINTGRGALVDTPAVIAALKNGHIGHLGLDVYEEEADLFFEDLSGQVISDDVFARLLTFPNVLITGHQGFFTADALRAIAETTIANLSDVEAGRECPNRVRPPGA